MTIPANFLPVLFAIAASAGAVQASVVVTFSDPDKYVDVGRDLWDRPDVLKEIEQYLQALGKNHLRPNQTLKVEVLDIDLAGDERFRPGAGRDIRILKGRADWPKVELRYSVEEAGKTVRSGEETVADMNYLNRPIVSTDRLPYEKRMLEEWFRTRSGSGKKARR